MTTSKVSARTEATLVGYLAYNRVKFAVRSGGGLLPMLRPELSRFSTDDPNERPPAAEQLRYRAVMAWRWAALWRFWGGSERAMRAAEKRAHDEIIKAGVAPFGAPLPVREFTKDDVGTPAFVEALGRPVPFVVRGWASDMPAVRDWSVPALLERYGDEQVMLTHPDRGDYQGPLRDILQPDVYVHNGETLFKRNPELLQQLDLQMLEEQAPGDGLYLTSQLFIGLGGTGTPYHCANQVNLFMMVSGRKRWTFVDPRFTMFMAPAVKADPSYFGSHVGWASDPNPQVPLYAYVPRYAVDLDPGDVVFNPPWWWHSVENLTPGSIGAATRWGSDFGQTNVLFHLFQKTSATILRRQYRMVRARMSKVEPISPWVGDSTEFETAAHDSLDTSPLNARGRRAHRA